MLGLKYSKTMKALKNMIVLALMLFNCATIHGANVQCHDVRYKYSRRGMDVYDVPLTPQSGKKTIIIQLFFKFWMFYVILL